MKILVLILVALSSGCALQQHSVVNIGDSDIDGVSVRSGKYQFGHGVLIPQAPSSYMGSMKIRRNPPPVISWQNSEDGQAHSRTVRLPSSLKWGKEVVFEIKNDDVSVHYE